MCPVCDDGAARAPTFGEDVAFLQRHTDAFVLSDGAGEAQVAVVPLYQGRVMTSTAGGPGGTSFGWLNRELIARGERQPHINVFGGEDRFWLGPEGGQYSLFFKPGAPFDLAHWQTPAAIDWGGWKTAGRTETEAHFRKAVTQTNYTGTVLKLRVDRTVRLIARDRAARQLGVTLDPALDVVAFETDNRITHIGAEPWTPQGGLPSIWILGMFNPSDTTTIVIPFKPGPEAELGPVVNDAYFGKVPPDRLKVGDGVLYFRGDGRYRSKIGIGPERARPVLGSYDALRRVLTLVQYTLPDNAAAYVNSMWELQDEPYGGDVVNSYNDGPPAPGAPPLGPFYELETSSPAAALLPGQTLRHIHRTIHLQGPETALEPVARAALGVSPAEIRAAFGN
ncbi:MAG: hypothetical protein JW951_02540 [Lentisphaerae bacterium]|nr:hypothetical protein [Lentisphaerota bacterium]